MRSKPCAELDGVASRLLVSRSSHRSPRPHAGPTVDAPTPRAGCIYEYDDGHPVGGKGFTEEDEPNYAGSARSQPAPGDRRAAKVRDAAAAERLGAERQVLLQQDQDHGGGAAQSLLQRAGAGRPQPRALRRSVPGGDAAARLRGLACEPRAWRPAAAAASRGSGCDSSPSEAAMLPVQILRLRMPISDRLCERNFVYKIARYHRVRGCLAGRPAPRCRGSASVACPGARVRLPRADVALLTWRCRLWTSRTR